MDRGATTSATNPLPALANLLIATRLRHVAPLVRYTDFLPMRVRARVPCSPKSHRCAITCDDAMSETRGAGTWKTDLALIRTQQHRNIHAGTDA